MGQMGDTKDKKEFGTKKKEEKKWHTTEIERKVEMIQTGRRKVRCCGTERWERGNEIRKRKTEQRKRRRKN